MRNLKILCDSIVVTEKLKECNDFETSLEEVETPATSALTFHGYPILVLSILGISLTVAVLFAILKLYTGNKAIKDSHGDNVKPCEILTEQTTIQNKPRRLPAWDHSFPRATKQEKCKKYQSLPAVWQFYGPDRKSAGVTSSVSATQQNVTSYAGNGISNTEPPLNMREDKNCAASQNLRRLETVKSCVITDPKIRSSQLSHDTKKDDASQSRHKLQPRETFAPEAQRQPSRQRAEVVSGDVTSVRGDVERHLADDTRRVTQSRTIVRSDVTRDADDQEFKSHEEHMQEAWKTLLSSDVTRMESCPDETPRSCTSQSQHAKALSQDLAIRLSSRRSADVINRSAPATGGDVSVGSNRVDSSDERQRELLRTIVLRHDVIDDDGKNIVLFIPYKLRLGLANLG